MIRTSFVAIAALMASVVDTKLGFGECPKVNFMDNVDTERYAGRWYTILRDDDKNPMYMSRCGMMEIKAHDASYMQMHA